jgi:hypothetical protein
MSINTEVALIQGMKNLRKKWMIEPTLQKNIISHFLILGIVMVLVNFLSFYYLLTKILTHLERINQISAELYELVMETWTQIVVVSSVMSSVIVCIFGIYGLFFSNRIAGPIYNLRKSIERILSNKSTNDSVTEIKFRKGDYFQDLSAEMNLLIARFSKKN